MAATPHSQQHKKSMSSGDNVTNTCRKLSEVECPRVQKDLAWYVLEVAFVATGSDRQPEPVNLQP